MIELFSNIIATHPDLPSMPIPCNDCAVFVVFIKNMQSVSTL